MRLLKTIREKRWKVLVLGLIAILVERIPHVWVRMVILVLVFALGNTWHDLAGIAAVNTMNG